LSENPTALAVWSVNTILLIHVIVGGFLGMLLVPYTLNSWLVFFGKESTIVWWKGALIGIIPGIGELMIPAAFITFVLMLFL